MHISPSPPHLLTLAHPSPPFFILLLTLTAQPRLPSPSAYSMSCCFCWFCPTGAACWVGHSRFWLLPTQKKSLVIFKWQLSSGGRGVERKRALNCGWLTRSSQCGWIHCLHELWLGHCTRGCGRSEGVWWIDYRPGSSHKQGVFVYSSEWFAWAECFGIKRTRMNLQFWQVWLLLDLEFVFQDRDLVHSVDFTQECEHWVKT